MKRFVHAGATLLLIGTIAACGGKKKEAPKSRPPAPVEVAQSTTRTIPVVLEAVGTVEAYASVVVRSQVNDEITTVNFQEGQDVAAGQVLFTLDRRAVDAAIRKAEANLVRLLAVQKNAQANADRYSRLIKDGIVTQEQYDTFRTQAESGAADVAAAKAELDNQRVQLSYLVIKAPMAGRTGNLLVDRGNLVKSNDTTMVTINQVKPIYVTFAVPERELDRIRQQLGKGKLTVEARLTGDTALGETGKISFLDNAVDPATATIKLKGTFANGKNRLWPGQFATVRLTLATLVNAVVVPSQAVQTGQQGQYVLVVAGDTAELRPVKSGVAYEGVTVIEQGLKQGETIIIDGQMRVVPGGKVMVKQPGGPGKLPGSGTVEQGKADKQPAPAAPASSAKP